MSEKAKESTKREWVESENPMNLRAHQFALMTLNASIGFELGYGELALAGWELFLKSVVMMAESREDAHVGLNSFIAEGQQNIDRLWLLRTTEGSA